MNWRDFFNAEHSIYVSKRHRLLHDQLIAKNLTGYLPDAKAHVLDYGCGQASFAASIAQSCEKLYLFDTSRLVQMSLRRRFGDEPKITILDSAAFENFPPSSLDAIFVVSVTQYVGEAEFSRWLENFYRRLKPGALLVIGDVPSREASVFDDARALLAFAWRGGFFFAACFGLLRTYFSHYRDIREKMGFTTYSEAEMLEILDEHDFDAQRANQNIGHNSSRMTFLARKRLA